MNKTMESVGSAGGPASDIIIPQSDSNNKQQRNKTSGHYRTQSQQINEETTERIQQYLKQR